MLASLSGYRRMKKALDPEAKVNDCSIMESCSHTSLPSKAMDLNRLIDSKPM